MPTGCGLFPPLIGDYPFFILLIDDEGDRVRIVFGTATDFKTLVTPIINTVHDCRRFLHSATIIKWN